MSGIFAPSSPNYPVVDLAVPALAASWTNFNVTTLTKTDGSGGLKLTAPSNSSANSVQGVEQAISGNYTLSTLLSLAITPAIYNEALLYIRDNTNKLTTFGVNWGGAGEPYIQVDHRASATGAPANVYNTPVKGMFGGLVFLRIQDNGVNHLFSYSNDGDSYVQLFSESRTAYLGSTQSARGAGFDAFSQACAMTIRGWTVT